jgi:hypothetical protein
VVEWLEAWTFDQKVVGSNPATYQKNEVEMTKKITNKKTFKIGTKLVGALLGEIAAVIRRA